MSTATLTFNLPEEEEEFSNAVNGSRFNAVCAKMDDFLRGKVKYGEPTPADENAYQNARYMLHDILEDFEVSIW